MINLATLAGRHFIEGFDLYNTFSVFVESGSDGFLQYPAAKEGLSHDWGDASGTDVDLARRYFQPRTITLKCGCLVGDENEFWAKHRQLISLLMQPGKRRIEVAAFGQQSYFVYFKECSQFDRLTPIKDTNLIGTKFSLVLVENEPQLVNDNTFIVDEYGNFLIT